MPPLQHLYNDLPAVRTIQLLHGNGLARRWHKMKMKTEILREAFKSSKTLIHCVTLYKYQFHDKITKNLRVALRN